MKHKQINLRHSMHSGDCYLYECDCTCGKKFGGWSPDEADKEFMKHVEEVKNGS